MFLPRFGGGNESVLAGERNMSESRPRMMAGLFAVLTIAFLLNACGLRALAISCLLVSLGLCVGLFLWEIYSPDTGFRMPWLQV